MKQKKIRKPRYFFLMPEKSLKKKSAKCQTLQLAAKNLRIFVQTILRLRI